MLSNVIVCTGSDGEVWRWDNLLQQPETNGSAVCQHVCSQRSHRDQESVEHLCILVASYHEQFFSRPAFEGWPHHGHTFSIYLRPLSFWLTLPQGVLSTSWCCLSRPWMVFLASMHLVWFLALSVSPGNSVNRLPQQNSRFLLFCCESVQTFTTAPEYI